MDTRPVGPGEVDELAELFGEQRSTRHCWCTAFCQTRTRFALGWVTGGNRRRFELLASETTAPMGVLASVGGRPVGWCACGPRARYAVAVAGRAHLLRDRHPVEDDSVWLLPCFFVSPEHRGQGITDVLIDAAVRLARDHGAVAIEGWPHAGPDVHAADAFVGREQAFEAHGFRCVARPDPRRAIMRLGLT